MDGYQNGKILIKSMKQTKYFCQACFQIEMFGQTNLTQHEHYYKAERVNSEHQHQQMLEDNEKRYLNWLNNYRIKKNRIFEE